MKFISKTPSKSHLALLVGCTLFAASCGDSVAAEAESAGAGDQFCAAAADTEDIMADIDVSDPDKDDLEKINKKFKEVRELLPEEASDENQEFLLEQEDLTDGNGIEFYTLEDRDKIRNNSRMARDFGNFIDSYCDGKSAKESDSEDSDKKSDTTDASNSATSEKESTPVQASSFSTDGPSGNYENVTVTVAQVAATTAEPVSYLTDAPEEPTDNNYVLVKLDLEATTDDTNSFSAQDFKLELSDGTSVAGESLLDDNGQLGKLSLRGRDSTQGYVVFQTNSFLTSVSDVAIIVSRNEDVPLKLPFEGVVEATYPLTLEDGQTGQMVGKPAVNICDTLFNTTVKDATIRLETFADVTNEGRAGRNTRFVDIMLETENITNATEGSVSQQQSCNSYSGILVDTNIRLLADGKPLSNETASFRWPNIKVGSAEDINLVYEIPLETKEITLVGHEDDDILATWKLTLAAVAGE